MGKSKQENSKVQGELPKVVTRSVMLGSIICVTDRKEQALFYEGVLKKNGYHSVITEYDDGLYTVKGIEKGFPYT
jgi:hypothetical protein